jgi:hypothetical protein
MPCKEKFQGEGMTATTRMPPDKIKVGIIQARHVFLDLVVSFTKAIHSINLKEDALCSPSDS